MSRPLVIAHRTCPLDAPENSREGIAHAARVGADAVEVDVRLSRDGIAVLSHDPVVVRTTGRPLPVRWTRASTLTRLRLLDSTERLPSFAEAIHATPASLEIAVDVKDGVAMDAAVEVLAGADALGRARLWSTHPDAVAVAARRAPTNERAWLHNTRTEAGALRYLDRAVELGANAVSVMDVSLTPTVVRAGHDLGLTVHSWVRTLAVQDRVLACEPDGVVTDWPVEARARISAG